jgi:hypothetical protein
MKQIRFSPGGRSQLRGRKEDDGPLIYFPLSLPFAARGEGKTGLPPAKGLRKLSKHPPLGFSSTFVSGAFAKMHRDHSGLPKRPMGAGLLFAENPLLLDHHAF